MSQLAYKEQIFRKLKRIVIKVGSGVLADEHGPRREVIGAIAQEVASQTEQGRSVVVVTSGAVASGKLRLGYGNGSRNIVCRQAAAAVGQIELMRIYADEFNARGLLVAQLLLTHQDLAERHRRENARRTIEALLRRRVIPIINENDTVAVEELRFGDNDRLSALVAALVEAELLVILSDVDGVLTGDPRQRRDVRRIPLIPDVQDGIRGVVTEGVGPHGTGGMASKLRAAQEATRAGTAVIIACGLDPGGLHDALDPKKETGTLILPAPKRLNHRKHWIAYALKPTGALRLDSGAAEALRRNGKSLLPSGVKEVIGDFQVGDCVRLVDEQGEEFARGLVNYPASDLAKLKGRKTSEIVRVLGYKIADEVIHRDNLVLLRA